MCSDEISVVLPTFNRADALRRNLGTMLAMRGISEVIVVNDGSTDDTIAACEEFDDKRLKLVNHARNFGVARARNTGVQNASGSWVLFGEDDCRFPVDYAIVLRDEAKRYSGDIVGAPILHLKGTDEDAAKLAAAAPRTTRKPPMELHLFPAQTVETPFLPARVIVRRALFEKLSFYEGFLVNGYREETDFFVQAARNGYHCLLTPNTYCYQLNLWRGGQHHSSKLHYEYWALRNNWRYLRRQGSWLIKEGYIHSLTSAQIAFAADRVKIIVSGYSRATVSRIRALVPGTR